MRPRICLKVLSPLLKKPFFTAKQARAIGVSSSVLCHYVKTGKLTRVCRGVYQSIRYRNLSAFCWEDLIQAVYSIQDSVVCLVSALAIYGLTEEIPRRHWIGIRHGTSVKRNALVKIVRFRNFELGKTTIEIEGVRMPIFDRERTIVDAFRLLGREIAIKALKVALSSPKKNRLDLMKLEAYAEKLRFDMTPYLLSVTT